MILPLTRISFVNNKDSQIKSGNRHVSACDSGWTASLKFKAWSTRKTCNMHGTIFEHVHTNTQSHICVSKWYCAVCKWVCAQVRLCPEVRFMMWHLQLSCRVQLMPMLTICSRVCVDTCLRYISVSIPVVSNLYYTAVAAYQKQMYRLQTQIVPVCGMRKHQIETQVKFETAMLHQRVHSL